MSPSPLTEISVLLAQVSRRCRIAPAVATSRSRILLIDLERRAAIGAEGFATPTQLPTCFDEPAYANPLDPPCLTGCSPELASHMPPNRLLQSSEPTSTPYVRSEPGRPCLRSDVQPAARPLAGESQPSSFESGVARQFLAVSTPAWRPLALRIYPDSSSSRTPSCREADTAFDWKKSTTAICGGDPSRRRISSPWHARPRPGHDRGRGLPLGPPSIAPRERCDGRLHPGCLPPFPSSLRLRRGALLARGGGSAGGFPRIGRA